MTAKTAGIEPSGMRIKEKKHKTDRKRTVYRKKTTGNQ